MLNFWASWCEPCQIEAPLLERAQSQLERHDATVLGVTYLDASPDSLSFVRRYHLTYPNLRDNAGTFAHSYGTDQLPESFVIDRQGHVVAISRGEIDQAFLTRAVALAEARDRGGELMSAATTSRRRPRLLLLVTLLAIAVACSERERRGGGHAHDAADDRAPGDVRHLQNTAERRPVPAGRSRASVHPGSDRPGRDRSADQARARRSVRPHRARPAANARLRPGRLPRRRSPSCLRCSPRSPCCCPAGAAAPVRRPRARAPTPTLAAGDAARLRGRPRARSTEAAACSASRPTSPRARSPRADPGSARSFALLATHSAIRRDSTASGSAPTTWQSR